MRTLTVGLLALLLLPTVASADPATGGSTPLPSCTPAMQAPSQGQPVPCVGHIDPAQASPQQRGNQTGGMRMVDAEPGGGIEIDRAIRLSCPRTYTARQVRAYRKRLGARPTDRQKRKLKRMRACRI